ncbi:MAG: hypothetical protein ACFFAU_01095 [Candidatus Hodarchaeota archaeon]
MKYRILNNGKHYIAQLNVLYFFWETVKYCIGVAGGLPIFVPMKFTSEKSAVDFIKRKYRKNLTRVRKYSIV